jgi:hypothetical protein
MEPIRPMLIHQVRPDGLDGVLPDATPADKIHHGPCLVSDPDVEAVDRDLFDADLEVPRLARAA